MGRGVGSVVVGSLAGGEVVLGPATTAEEEGSAVEVPAGFEENESRFEPSLLFKTVFMRDKRPFFFPAPSGPGCAEDDIVNVLNY